MTIPYKQSTKTKLPAVSEKEEMMSAAHAQNSLVVGAVLVVVSSRTTCHASGTIRCDESSDPIVCTRTAPCVGWTFDGCVVRCQTDACTGAEFIDSYVECWGWSSCYSASFLRSFVDCFSLDVSYGACRFAIFSRSQVMCDIYDSDCLLASFDSCSCCDDTGCPTYTQNCVDDVEQFCFETTDLFRTCQEWGNPICEDMTSPPMMLPTQNPTKLPTFFPTRHPTPKPSPSPTRSPTRSPTNIPTQNPTFPPSVPPTNFPTQRPTMSPTDVATQGPTISPTNMPTKNPTLPTTMPQTNFPTQRPTISPTNMPTERPTKRPTISPTNIKTERTTISPTKPATNDLVTDPTFSSMMQQTVYPTHAPTKQPPTQKPTKPTTESTNIPANVSTANPSNIVARSSTGVTPISVPANSSDTGNALSAGVQVVIVVISGLFAVLATVLGAYVAVRCARAPPTPQQVQIINGTNNTATVTANT